MRMRMLLLLSSLPFVVGGAVTVIVLAVSGADPNDITRSPVALSNDPAPATDPQGGAPVTAPAADQPMAVRRSRQDQLHDDYTMTRYMSDPNASGSMFTGQVTDPQSQRSSDPAYVRELETHQQDIDRMLGRGAP